MGLTLQQRAMRRQGIGASEAAAVIGLNPHCRPITIWRRKVQLGADADEGGSAHTERGEFLEDGLRRWYAHRSGHTVRQSGTLVHPEEPRILATPDGIAEAADGERLLEIKSPSRFNTGEWGAPGTDQVPDAYLIQATWAMAVAKLARADVVGLIKDDLAVYPVPFVPELFAEVRAAAMEFWERYVVPQREPPVDESRDYGRYLSEKYRWVREEAAALQAKRDQAAWVRRYQEARVRAGAFDDELERAKNHLRHIMGEHTHMSSRYGTVTWKANADQEVVDWQAVARAAGAGPDLIAKHTRAKKGPRVLRVPEPSDEDVARWQVKRGGLKKGTK